MKLLITGADSYVGTKAADYLKKIEPEWIISQLDVRTDEWTEHDFTFYDTIFHLAGLAHRKLTPDIEPLYYKVNRDLSIEVAKKARESAVKHFIFMSSMSVYSDGEIHVDEKTPVNPDNAYGKSKLQAEEGIKKLSTDDFIISIIRPPMIYGRGCKGNYNSLRTIALKSPVFPQVRNKRSMLFIDNFSEFMHQLILRKKPGVFYPQNSDLVNTAEWVKYIAEAHGKKVHMSSFLGVCARLGKYVPGIKGYCIKAFGDSYYDPRISDYPDMPYQIVSFRESIKKTEQ